MAAVNVPVQDAPTNPEWARKYPPLLAIGVALLIAVFVLPSSLNLPQTNPTTTLEYAPVPPNDQDDAPPDSNFESLGLGSSSGIEGGGASGGDTGAGPADTLPPPVGKGTNPTTYRCVGNPPRQTEDPLSPPCVAFFDGDNFGATYSGVTGEEIRLLVYIDAPLRYIGADDQSESVSPTNTYFDLFQPPDDDEFFLARGFRPWQKYFNERFQTYNRKVHFFIYFSNCQSTCSPEKRRADAADNYLKVKPFAVITDAGGGFEEDYLFAMAKRGVLNFGSFGGRSNEFFNQFPKLIWGYQPSIEQQIDQYATYVCSKVVGHPSVLAGPDPGNGKARQLGMLYTSDSSQPGLIKMGQEIKKRVQACGGEFPAPDARYPRCCLAQDNSDHGTYAEEQMAQFKQAGVTTILWTGGIVDKYGRAAQAINYVPEWIVLGDQILDANNPPRLAQMSTAWDGHAVTVSPQTFQPALEQQRCYQAYREADQQESRANLGYLCDYYKNLFQFFVGVQVAGPRLGPTSVDKGFHAIPARPSGDPQSPACFYNTNDYTCVKDAQAEIWEGSETPPGDNRPGCWKPFEGGKRYLPGNWPAGNIDAQMTGNEVCNGYSAAVSFYPYPV